LRLGDRLLARYRRRPPDERPEVWLTCAASDDAPDWLGPIVSRGLGIPYVLVQPRVGPADAATGRATIGAPLRSVLEKADAVVSFGNAGLADLRDLVDRPDRLIELPPFLDLAAISTVFRDREHLRATLASRLLLPTGTPWLIVMAGAEPAAWQDSVALMARGLSRFPFLDWGLVVAGDGPAHDQAEAAFRVLPRERVRFHRSHTAAEAIPLFAAGDLFLGPPAGEGSRTAMLLAMACGLPIVACRGSAAGDIVRNGITGTLTEPDNAESYGNAVSFLLRQPSFRASFAENARKTALADHDIGAIAQALDDILRRTADPAATKS
jgi:hypothetical protein